MKTQNIVIFVVVLVLLIAGLSFLSKGGPFEVIGVNLQENKSLVEKFVEQKGLTFPIVLDPASVAARSYGVRYTNYHILIDKFVSIKDAEKFLDQDDDGIVVSVGNIFKFYPYKIMVWHEIVNGVVSNKPLVITFCPLCRSAIVFDTKDQFGVSGKLYESNLLMYDKGTESLWSQSIGTAVVGDRTGEKLSVYPSQVLSLETFKTKWPDGQVLSTDTGFSRSYGVDPYGDYGSNDDIFFPISVKDNRLPVKEI